MKRITYSNVKLLLPICLAFCLLTACDKKTDATSEPADSTSAKAETDSTDASNSESSGDAPGSIELPPGDIPETVESGEGTDGAGIKLPETASSKKAEIKYATWEEIEKFVSSTGKVTVVDVWSTACAPCLAEFPNLVQLHKDLGDQLQCVSVDIDYDGRKTKPAESYENAIVTFLTYAKADFPNFVCKTPSEDVYNALEIESIPAVLVFGQDGKLSKKFIDVDGGFSYHDDVVPHVKELLGS